MPVSERTYRQIALEDPDGGWELHCGRLRQKPPVTWAHGDAMERLGSMLTRQLDPEQFAVRTNFGRVRRSAESYYIPDVYVVPREVVRRALREEPRGLEVYEAPLPLVVEIWSPSTGEYDVDSKIPEYQRRGDLEIWRLHPFERSLKTWRRRPDGSYEEREHREGTISPQALPGVAIDVAALFA